MIASMTTLPGATCAQGLLYGQCSSRTFHGPSMHWGMLLHQNTSNAAIPTPCPGGPLPGHAGGLHAVGHGLAEVAGVLHSVGMERGLDVHVPVVEPVDIT